MEYGEYNYTKLLNGLSQNHMFEVEKLALEIFRVCHDISTRSKKECGPEYEKMVYHIRHAYKACCKIELSIWDNQEPDPSDLWLEEIKPIVEELANSMKAKENAE